MSFPHFLGEDDFLDAMNGECRIWRDRYVRDDNLTLRDGSKMHYYIAEHEDPSAVIVFLHGFCEFWGKYHEFAWYLWQAGYTVYFPELRGHGYSDGKQPEEDIVFIDSFDTYVKDVHDFLKKVVLPATEGKTRILMSHSMGGAIAGLLLETYPGIFSAALFCSPMFRLTVGNLKPPAIMAVRFATFVLRRQRQLLPGQHRFDGVNVFERSSTLSKPRYDYQFHMRIEDHHFQTYASSLGWAIAGLKAGKKVISHAGRITIPVTLFRAGQDTLVRPEAFDEFKAKAPQAVIMDYPESKHEIFNATEDIRKAFFTDVLSTLDSYRNLK
ncbi:MAG: lysophospholipase [Lachnospiraceae bacterium]|nr:lysophospholipase [Lachnospiraceae bacterium]